MTQEAIQNLKEGDKLIFIEHSGVVSGRPGDVLTFWRWSPPKEDYKHRPEFVYWQALEFKDEAEHSFSIYTMEQFNPEIHKEYRILTTEIDAQNVSTFISKYGS